MSDCQAICPVYKEYEEFANFELHNFFYKTFGKSIWRIMSRYTALLIEMVRTDNDSVASLQYKFKYNIERLLGHTRANLADLFLFPEQLTHFVMKEYHLSFKEATAKFTLPNSLEIRCSLMQLNTHRTQ